MKARKPTKRELQNAQSKKSKSPLGPTSVTGQIREMLAQGKSVERIASMTGRKMSFVSAVKEEMKEAK